jgi:hypothetical protein
MSAGPRREKRKCNPCNMLPPLVPMNRRKRVCPKGAEYQWGKDPLE